MYSECESPTSIPVFGIFCGITGVYLTGFAGVIIADSMESFCTIIGVGGYAGALIGTSIDGQKLHLKPHYDIGWEPA